jgi:hypothetical protein
MRRRGKRPGHPATTAHYQAAYPFLGMGALGTHDIYIGTDRRSPADAGVLFVDAC